MLGPTRMLRTMVSLAIAALLLIPLAGDAWSIAQTTTRKPAAKETSPSSLSAEITRLLARSELKGTTSGVHVLRLRDGKTLYQRDADRTFIPASNAKLFTTAAALQTLGPDFEFRTLIGSTRVDLVVIGGGDPTIGGRLTDGDPTAYFRRWAQLLKQQRLTVFPGDLVLDDSLFDRQVLHPRWSKNDVGHWYAAPIAALVFNDSCVEVQVEPGKEVGEPGTVAMLPNTRFFEVVNRTRTVATSKEHAPRVTRGSGHHIIQCDGTVYQHAQPITSWVPVDDPVMYFGTVLKEVLDREGITIEGKIRRGTIARDGGEFRPRVVHRFGLIPVLSITNKESQNLYAEQLFKTLGTVRGDGSWDNGREVVRDALIQMGVETGNLVLDDGCGLSRSNRATPRAFTALLAAMHRSPHGETFRQTLSQAGEDGTLKKRLTDEICSERVWAKTGSITGVRAISGYAQDRAGDWLAFSLLVNNVRVSIRGVQDEFIRALVNSDAAGTLVRHESRGSH